jgi:hypothetical protein
LVTLPSLEAREQLFRAFELLALLLLAKPLASLEARPRASDCKRRFKPLLRHNGSIPNPPAVSACRDLLELRQGPPSLGSCARHGKTLDLQRGRARLARRPRRSTDYFE